MTAHPPPLILASSSPYRRRLLQRLQTPFDIKVPAIDETPRPDEPPDGLALRLSVEKSLAVSRQEPAALVLGSDQVAAVEGITLGKPITDERAREQLRRCNGNSVQFYTAVALCRDGELVAQRCVETEVQFRQLSEQQIAAYIEREQPLDCAGSFRWEALGIALFRHLRSDDPTALEGLPLITVVELLEKSGLSII